MDCVIRLEDWLTEQEKVVRVLCDQHQTNRLVAECVPNVMLHCDFKPILREHEANRFHEVSLGAVYKNHAVLQNVLQNTT